MDNVKFETMLETISDEQSWHKNLESLTSFNVSVPNVAGLCADDAVKAWVWHVGAERVLNFINMRYPIEARSEFSRKAGGQNTTQAKFEAAKNAMPGWDWKATQSTASAATKEALALVTSKNAKLVLEKLQAARAMVKLLLGMNVDESVVKAQLAQMYPDVNYEAVKAASEM